VKRKSDGSVVIRRFTVLSFQPESCLKNRNGGETFRFTLHPQRFLDQYQPCCFRRNKIKARAASLKLLGLWILASGRYFVRIVEGKLVVKTNF
jgi:hypothetical protein